MPTSYEDIPATLKRSPLKAQRTYRKVHTAAKRQYHDEERAHRTAFAVLKESFEKVGDHWVPKKHKGPSAPRSTRLTAAKRRGEGETSGGVDLFGHSRQELYDRARSLDVAGRSRMSKRELARAIARVQ